MALFTDARELGGQRQAVTPGYKVKEKNWLQKGALAAMGLNPDMTTNIWGKINPFLGPSQAIFGEMIDPELNPAKERMASSLQAGKLAMNFVPGGAGAKLLAGTALSKGADALSSKSTASSSVPNIGPSTPQMDKIDPLTGKAWTGSKGDWKNQLDSVKTMYEDGLLSPEEEKRYLEAVGGNTINDDVADAFKAADDVDTDALIAGDTATDVADATSDVANKGVKGAKLKAAMGKAGNVLGKAGLAASVVGDVYGWHKSRQAGDQAVKDKKMELREKKKQDLGLFSYT